MSLRPLQLARGNPARMWMVLILASGLLLESQPAAAQSSIGNVSIRPFVVGFVPVRGRNGVGGVTVDAAGVLARADTDMLGRLRRARLEAADKLSSPLTRTSHVRKVSLRRLQEVLAQHGRNATAPDEEIQYLAGLQRIQFVFVYPEQRDIVLAGFAEGWQVNQDGDVVGTSTGQPVLQLDDLLVALRSAAAAAEGRGISCSIDPTQEGLVQLQKLFRQRGLPLQPATLRRMEQLLGPQAITISGVASDCHFARVMVAADFVMKRLAMGFESAPVEGLPSYLQLLSQDSTRLPANASPRWWLAAHYQPLLKAPDGLAWQLQGPGVQVLTEDSYVDRFGGFVDSGKSHPLAEKWAQAMTRQYSALAAEMPIFAKLRNCMDLAVVAALILKEDLTGSAGLELPLLLNPRKIQVARYPVPKTVGSKANLLRKGRSWFVTVSGGVDIDSWAALEHIEQNRSLAAQRRQAGPGGQRDWWWD